MKVDSKNFKGIEYVQLNELPLAQQQTLLQSINSDFFIKILIDGTIVSQCLQYKDYAFWYSNHFAAQSSSAQEENIQKQEVTVNANQLAFR
jgi:hypothetical protein